MTAYGPIQKVLIRGSFFGLEDKIAAYKSILDAERGGSDVGSIDADVGRMETDLSRLRPLLAR